MSRYLLYLFLFVISTTSQISAGGSVSFATVQKILQQSPATWKHLNNVFHFAEGGGAVRLGRHWPHVGGARIAPYNIEVTSKADPSIKFDLTVQCETVFYDKNNQKIDPEDDELFTKSVKFSEKFLNVVLTPVEPKKTGKGAVAKPPAR